MVDIKGDNPNLHFVVTVISQHGLIVFKRTDRAYASLDECEHACHELVRRLDMFSRRALHLLGDLRSAPPRSDPAFESMMGRYRKEIFRNFLLSAVLVRTAWGKMQMRRHIDSDGLDVPIFHEPNEALAYFSLPKGLYR